MYDQDHLKPHTKAYIIVLHLKTCRLHYYSWTNNRIVRTISKIYWNKSNKAMRKRERENKLFDYN